MLKPHIPKVSIGMPVYNGESFLRAALDSLLAQTFTDFELIISDNASTDATQLICEEYSCRDQRIQYVRQYRNKGALANFQFVLDQSQGELFMWAAADDLWDKHWISALYASNIGHKDVATFGGLVHIDGYSKSIQHPANNANLQFIGVTFLRQLAFFLAYEGKGKANLFYALYPRKSLEGIELSRFDFDYQILFSLLGRVAFRQAEGAYLHKRIHADCAGGEVEDVWRPPIYLAPLRVLHRDLLVATHYLQIVDPWLRMVLRALIPVKLLSGIKFHMLRFSLKLLITRTQ